MTGTLTENDDMTIAPGIYALHRAGEAPVPRALDDAGTGLHVAAGVSDTGAGPGGVTVCIVTEGRARVGTAGEFGAGEAVVTQGATKIEAVDSGSSWVTVRCGDADLSGDAMPLRPSDHPELPSCDPTPADLLLSGPPAQHDLTLFKDQACNFAAGFWDTTAYHRKSIAFPKFEVMHMLSGWIELTLDEGGTHRFEAGDTFLIAKGTRCDWRTGGMGKIFCTLVPAT
ncbi:cupin domain-containing protein [Allosediminivita pacifica]|uniref:Putative cupin superfamily protein n=1 Tax=Allosediminivita pacifica TaxID=1267769 RepID=A0A2T5ZWF4_9RHOB|nr:cupin domain-containing protein [Allosediminivita pacifica]PTX35872.1 putative cupin superfamily protein [Allosediminivita pacifica]GGB30996.1 hypothetical protein GCM10011324_45590 [Allosediminivita pacifica]